MTKSFGIYIHVPFCASKCHYCSFSSSVQTREVQEKYFEKLWQEIDASQTREVSSIYFGGGTPSAVSSSLVCRTLGKIFEKFEVKKDAEITIEANPCSVNAEKLSAYKATGFNRISFGAQSFEDETLKVLGRTHSVSQIFKALEMAKMVGFDNISLDVILGARPLNRQKFVSGIEKAKALGVKHISAYMLSVDKGTALFESVKTRKIEVCDDKQVSSEYLFVQKTLENMGFMQYEISNFALVGFEGKHNQNYWKRGEYLGFGLSAHSHKTGVRSENTSNLNTYLESPLGATVYSEKLTPEQKIEEFIMLSLRTRRGIDLEKLKTMGQDILQEKKAEIQALIEQKMVIIENGFLKICPEKFVVSNAIILELI